MQEVFPPSTDIATLLNPRSVARFKRLPYVLSWLVILAGVLALLSWALKIGLFGLFGPAWISMKANTAVALVLAGVALRIRLPENRHPWSGRASQILAFLVAIIGAEALPELFSNGPAASPWHMSLLTALALILMGAALLSSARTREADREQRRAHRTSNLLSFVVAFLALLPLIAYSYGSRFTIGLATYSEMAPDTSLCLLAMSIAIFFSRIDHDLVAVLISEGPGATVARRLLPPAILFPFLLGWIRVAGETQGTLSITFGTALFATVTIACFLAFIWGQSVSLQRAELARRDSIREQERLKFEAELREKVLSFFSHDLRTPVTAATSYAELLLRSQALAEHERKHAEGILRSLARIDRMIEDTLNLSRARAGQHLHLRRLLASTMNELRLIHGNRFVVECPEETSGFWDPDALRRAIENLCVNAVKYGAPGRPIRVTVETLEAKVRISVHNDGPAIPPEEQERIFEAFHRAGSGERVAGWGIGLAQVRAMAEAHGGRVTLESSERLGTTFAIELPKDARLAREPRSKRAG